MKKLFLLLLVLSCTSCAIFRADKTASPRVEIVPDQWIQLPKPSQLAFNVTATQILTAAYKIQGKIYSHTTQVQVEKTPQRLVLVAVSSWGGQIFSIDYDGASIKTSSLPIKHATTGIQHVLTDFILTYARTDLVKNLLLSTDIKLTLKKNQRIFMLHNKPIIKIDYQSSNIWNSKITLNNLKLHYTIKITPVSYNLIVYVPHRYDQHPHPHKAPRHV